MKKHHEFTKGERAGAGAGAGEGILSTTHTAQASINQQPFGRWELTQLHQIDATK